MKHPRPFTLFALLTGFMAFIGAGEKPVSAAMLAPSEYVAAPAVDASFQFELVQNFMQQESKPDIPKKTLIGTAPERLLLAAVSTDLSRPQRSASSSQMARQNPVSFHQLLY